MEHEEHRHGDAQLAAAVVQRAVDDALSPRTTAWSSHPDTPTPECQRDAVAFCILRCGPWAREREFWCTLAGVDPDVVRQRVLSSLRGRAAKPCRSPQSNLEPIMKKPKNAPPANPVEPLNGQTGPAQSPPAPPPMPGVILITHVRGAPPNIQVQNMDQFEALGLLDAMRDLIKGGGLSAPPAPAAAA